MRLTTLLILLSFSGGLTHAERPQQTKPDTRQFEPAKPEPRKFPKHWGSPPRIQTRDMVKLPGKFGMGSSTLASWIRENLKKDADKPKPQPKPTPKPKPPEEPTPPIVPLPPEDVKEKMNEYKDTQKKLQTGLQEKLKSLGKKPSKELVRKTVEKYKQDNKDLIESQKEIGKTIQDWHKDNRPARPKRPEPTAEVKEKIQAVKEKEKEMHSIRKDFQQTLKDSKDLTKQAREELIKEFKEKNADKHKALKDAQKELQKKIRETRQTGDRRE